jgi:Xaa-Pro aminopeptidase
MNTIELLINAEELAIQLFNEIENRGLIQAGKSENKLNTEIFELAKEMFGIEKYWHKRIVRAGKNTIFPYRENPADLIIQEEDILFLDFGPVFEDWEADLGKTYVLGENTQMLKMKADVETAWYEGYEFYKKNRNGLIAADFYKFTCDLAKKLGWKFGHIHCGHLIGKFPHERIQGEETLNYIHPENLNKMSDPDKSGNERFWIYEIHLLDKTESFGGFYEQLLR